MLNHDIQTVDETTETSVKFIKKLNSPEGSLSSAQAIDRISSSVETDHSVNEVKSIAAHTSNAGHTPLTDSLSAKSPTMDRRPGGGCIPVSGLDR